MRSESPAERAEALLALMSLQEKLAQLVGVWVGADADGAGVAPHQADLTGETPPLSAVIKHGLGQLTRPFGTTPVEPAAGARGLAAAQAQIVAASQFGIPAQAAATSPRCRSGTASWPTSSCHRSRWRCGWAERGR